MASLILPRYSVVLTSILSRNSRSFFAKSADRCASGLRDIYNILWVTNNRCFASGCSAVGPFPREVPLAAPQTGRSPTRPRLRTPRGEGVHGQTGQGPGRCVAQRGEQRIAVDGWSGLASSSYDVLDALAPVIPAPPVSRGEGRGTGWWWCRGEIPLVEAVQGWPRTPVLSPGRVPFRTWTCLRRDGLCGLTPDEAMVFRRALGRASRVSRVAALTRTPRGTARDRSRSDEGSTTGPRSLSRNSSPLSGRSAIIQRPQASYLPGTRSLRLSRTRVDTRISTEELGEWCRI